MGIQFTSIREKRLWIAAAVVQLTIFASLFISGSLRDTLVDPQVFVTLFILGFFAIVLAILVQALRLGRHIAEFGVLIAILGVYLLLFARLGSAERTHLFEYSTLTLLVFEAIKERSKRVNTIRNTALLAILITVSAGLIDEVLQIFIPSRVFDPIDILFNSFVSVMTVMASLVFAWVSKQFRKK